MNLNNLNDKQKAAIINTDGPTLVLAGAGSGKTKVLTTKIAYLVKEKNINPYNILAITFTNKAAKEMQERVATMLGSISKQIQISTFHSLGVLLIRENFEKLGYKSNFTILDGDDSLTVIKKIIKEMNLDVKQYNPKVIKNKISGAKNELLDASSYEKYASTEFEEKVVQIFRKYEYQLFINNSLDFDDLLILPIILLKNNSEILMKYQERFKYILVDEYQDTNEAQYVLTKLLSARYRNICVVGDNDQSIYSFRGANYRNILNFEKDYKEVKAIYLEENYRSTKNILNAANDVIKNNKKRKEKKLWTQNDVGLKIKYNVCETEKDESYYITNEIKKLIETGILKQDIAILYRTNAQSRAIEENLLRENIPYKVVGSFYFYKRKEIKDLISYLKLIYNSSDDISLLRVINVPKRGIGLKTLEKLSTIATDQRISIYDAITSSKEWEFKKIIEQLKNDSQTVSLTELIDLILDKTGMRQELIEQKSIEADIRLENLEEFKTITKNFEESIGLVSLEEFLDEISLVADIEEHKNNNEVVTLMTVHAAKGLEFDNVFIAGVEEGIFPHKNSLLNEEEMEEERRLCYVAITRAKKNLHLVSARKRTIFGDVGFNPPSRFISEIDEEYLEISNIQPIIEKNKKQILSIDNSVVYQCGEHIIHDTYGEGVIIVINKDTLQIAFSVEYGIKTLIKGHKSIKKK